jgi:hypothetical protein
MGNFTSFHRLKAFSILLLNDAECMPSYLHNDFKALQLMHCENCPFVVSEADKNCHLRPFLTFHCAGGSICHSLI